MRDLITYLGSTAIIVSGLAWVARRAADQWLSHRLEDHKAALTYASQLAVEQLKSDLRIQELRASRLVDEQASILAEVFARLERLHAALDAFSKPVLHEGGRAPELRGEAISRFKDLTDFYHPRAIWLERSTCDRLNELVELLGVLLWQLSSNVTDKGEVADRGRWVETYERINREIPAARAAIDEEFRAVLGVATGATEDRHIGEPDAV